MTETDVEKIIKSNMMLQMNFAGMRAEFEEKLQRKPLSWERVLEIGLECANDHSRLPFEVKVARAVEAAHGIK